MTTILRAPQAATAAGSATSAQGPGRNAIPVRCHALEFSYVHLRVRPHLIRKSFIFFHPNHAGCVRAAGPRTGSPARGGGRKRGGPPSGFRRCESPINGQARGGTHSSVRVRCAEGVMRAETAAGVERGKDGSHINPA